MQQKSRWIFSWERTHRPQLHNKGFGLQNSSTLRQFHHRWLSKAHCVGFYFCYNVIGRMALHRKANYLIGEKYLVSPFPDGLYFLYARSSEDVRLEWWTQCRSLEKEVITSQGLQEHHFCHSPILNFSKTRWSRLGQNDSTYENSPSQSYGLPFWQNISNSIEFILSIC